MVNRLKETKFGRSMTQWSSNLLSGISQSKASLVGGGYRPSRQEDEPKLAKPLRMSVQELFANKNLVEGGRHLI